MKIRKGRNIILTDVAVESIEDRCPYNGAFGFWKERVFDL